MQASVAIIIVNWNNFEDTNNCIHSLKAIQYPNYSIILIDNGSFDGSGQQLLQIHPELTFIESKTNEGFTGGNNLGLALSIQKDFTYSLLLNNDTFVEPDFLTNLVAYMEANQGVGVIQPSIYQNHNRKLLWNGGSYYSKWLGWMYTKGFNKLPSNNLLQIKTVDWVTGCAFLTRNSILKKSGLLSEKLFLYCEDVDLSLRIKKMGYQLIFYPGSVVYHIGVRSHTKKSKGQEGYLNPIVHYYHQRNRIWVLKKYSPWYCLPTVILFNFFYIILILSYFALRRRITKFKTVITAVKEGIVDSMDNKLQNNNHCRNV